MVTKQSPLYHSRVGRLLLGSAAFITFAAAPVETHALAIGFGSWDYVLRHDSEGLPQAAFARLRGENGSLLWLTCQRQILERDQSPISFVTAAVAQRQYLGRSDPRGRSTVYWFNGGSPQIGRWIYRDRYGQVPDADQVWGFVDELAQAKSLTIELSNYRYETQRHEFYLNESDTRNLADRFRQDCRDIISHTEG
jgi:hypothetical protein